MTDSEYKATLERLDAASQSTEPATRGYVFRLGKALADGVIAALKGRLGKIDARQSSTDLLLADLDRRLAALESRQLRYVGTHEIGRKYQRGEFVTHRGSLWHCECDTPSAPGDSDDWTLAAKRGRDAR